MSCLMEHIQHVETVIYLHIKSYNSDSMEVVTLSSRTYLNRNRNSQKLSSDVGAESFEAEERQINSYAIKLFFVSLQLLVTAF